MPEENKKLYEVDVTNSGVHYVSADDAFQAYSKVVAHEEKEGHHTHNPTYSCSVAVTEVDPAKLPNILAWQVSS